MGYQGVRWVVGEFSVFGVHFQNWMPLAVLIAALSIVYVWALPQFRERRYGHCVKPVAVLHVGPAAAVFAI